MRLSLRQLQIFVAVADHGSTTAAGQHIALSQSAASGALAELESALGTRVFDRIGKRLVLNDSGRILLPAARVLLDGAAAIEQQFGISGADQSGQRRSVHLRVGASTTIGNYVLPALAASYLRVRPESTIDVTIGNTEEIADAVARLRVDIGLIEGPCHDPELSAQPWLEDELVIVAAPSHPLLSDGPSRPLNLDELRAQRWLLREPGSGTREIVENALLPHLHDWRRPMQFGSNESIKSAAAEGLGLACLSVHAIKDAVTLGRLVVVNTSLPRIARMFYRICHREKGFSPGVAEFGAHCGVNPCIA